MIEGVLGSLPAMAIAGYESLIGMFGSPAVLLAIAVALVAVSIIELCVRRHTKEAV